MKKRGQITIFILIGIILIISITLLLSYNKTEINEKKFVSNEPIFIKQHIESCLKDTLNEGIIKMGENGGMLYPTEDIYVQYTEKYKFTYLYINKETKNITIELISKDLEKYVNDNIRYCIDDFIDYEKMGYNINFKDVNSSVNIYDKQIKVKLFFPITIIKNNEKYNIETISTEIEYDFFKVLNEVNDILNYVNNAQTEIDNAKKDNRYPEITFPKEYNEKDSLIILNYKYEDEESRMLWIIKQNNYRFLFATKVMT